MGPASGVADELELPIGESNDPRSLASGITYARRYSLIALLGIAPADEDDDDAQAVAPAAKPVRRQEPVSDPTSRPVPPVAVITEPQRKKLFAEASARGWTREQLKPWLLQAYGIESTAAIPQSRFDEILDRVALERPHRDRQPGEDG